MEERGAAIVWFRRDLRLADNPALAAAAQAHDRIVCVYIHAPDEQAPWAPGAASNWWLHHSLVALGESLRERGGALHVCHGPTAAALDRLLLETKARAVYWNRLYEPAIARRDRAVERQLRERGIDAQGFNANLLVEPWQVQTGSGGPYRVFTPYWRNVRASLEPRPPAAAPRRVVAAPASGGVTLDSLKLLPTIRWDSGFYELWRPGEDAAHRRLRQFVRTALNGYEDGRDRPDSDATSRLSPHLHFGEIGPRQILWALHGVQQSAGAKMHVAAEALLRELGWREFAHHLLHHFPRTPTHNLDQRFDAFAWSGRDDAALRRWQRGETGIPIVDAGMRQLWRTGWMHNRVRMLVASFLTKNLRQHWLHGARWFWDTLVDADLANNTLGWQWTAGVGADAAPYFRIFNPLTQAERFDPDGRYVRSWVPELAHHGGRSGSGQAGGGYPEPMVDLAASRKEALAAYDAMKAQPPAKSKQQ